MRKIIVAVAVACALGAYAEERTVSAAQGLFEALQALNGTDSTIYLETGNYDVGAYDYGGAWNSNSKYVAATGVGHLSLYKVTLIGKSDNPRDTVIYGNRTMSILRCHLANLRNLTVSNGYLSAETAYGGGVFCTDSSSVHSNIVVTCCTLDVSKKGNGGAAYYGTWYDCTIISNVATKTNGGAICYGDMYNCNIISNYAGNIGGGCYYGTILHDCRVIGNTALTGGGLASSDGGQACHVYGGVIADNSANSGGGAANTIVFHGGTVVSNNVVTSTGGGLYLGKSTSANQGLVSNTVICCNTATTGGGCANGTVVGCEIFGNHARTGGGVSGSICKNCTITNNVATQNGGGGNAGTYTNCVIAGNSATANGGGLYDTGCVAVDCRIYGNTAASGGGCGYGSFTDCTITNNLATGANGGGCYYGAYTNCLIACNSLLSLSVVSVSGGGLYGGVAVGCTIVSNTVGTLSSDSNSASYGGGASGSQIIDSIVGYNQSTGGVLNAFAGGLYTGSASNCLIVGNAAWGAEQNQGGGADHTALTNCIVCNNMAGIGTGLNYGSVYGCLISNNVSQTSAAANTLRRPTRVENSIIVGTSMMACWAKNCQFVNFTNGAYLAEGENIHCSGYIPGGTSPVLLATGLSMTNCLIAGNKGLYNLFSCSPTKGVDLVNCTIADNEANLTFTYTTNGIPGIVENCIFVGNTYQSNPRNLWYTQAATNLWLSNCLIAPGGRATYAPAFEVNTITNDNAGFVGGDGPDRYALRYGSRARGKGLVQDWMTDALDIRRDPAFPRLRDGAVDIGCYQCWLDPIGFSFSIR